MMRRQGDRFECAEHGGSFTQREAFEHLCAAHPDVAQLAERVLDANRDELPVNPAIGRFESRAARRRGERGRRRARKGLR